MSTTTHTPPPWVKKSRTFNNGYERTWGIYAKCSDGRTREILSSNQLDPKGISHGAAEANARLAIEAPAMLEVVKYLAEDDCAFGKVVAGRCAGFDDGGQECPPCTARVILDRLDGAT